MLTRLVRISLLAELAAYVFLGALVFARTGWSAAAIAVAAMALALGLRFLVVCATSLHGWVHRSPRAPAHRLGPGGTARLLWSEFLALLADNFYYLPFESLALHPDPLPSPGAPIPVVLVHGYLSNRGYFRPLARWLEERGVPPVFAPNYRSLFSTIEANAAELHAAVERIAAAGPQRVILVCHSMGGLLARRYLQDHGESRIARLVTIASPHHGTVLAGIGVGPHAGQMRRDSEFLRALEQAEAAQPPRVPTTSIYTVHDNLVAPQDTSRLDWARNVALGGVGHVGILADESVFALVLEELRAGGAAP